MDLSKSYKYYVVDILNPPSEDFGRYFFIPASWIRIKESDERVLVSLPFDERSIIKKCVRDGEEYSRTWTVLLAADVKYGADSYEEASNYITYLENRLLQEQSYAEIIKEHESSTSYEPKSPEDLSERDLELSDPPQIVPETPCANLSVATRKKQTKAETRVDIGDATNRKMTPPQSRDRQLPSTRTRSGENKLAHEHSAVIPNDSNYTTHESYVNDEENNNALSADDIIKLIFESDFLEQFKKKHSSLEKGLIRNARIRLHYDNMTAIIQLVENYKQDYFDQPNTTIEDITASDVDETGSDEEIVHEEANTNPILQKSQSADATVGDHNTDNYKKVLKNTPRKKHIPMAFTLPNEYDENDSRWTLKHPIAKPGLAELLPHSQVYVDASRLEICKKESSDSRSLARLLLTEVFSETALSVCSVTGKRTYYYNDMGYKKRPGLDEFARIVLFNYVDQYANEQKWPKVEVERMMHCIRNRVAKLRDQDVHIENS